MSRTWRLLYKDPAQDDYTRQELDSIRKPKLTLYHLNRLKKISSMKKIEDAAHKEIVATMYGEPAPEGGEGGFPGGGPDPF